LDEATVANGTRRERLPESATIALQIFGLAGLAVAQPLLSLLGENPTFFVAHRASTREILLFAIGVVLVPALMLIVPVLLIRLISVRAGIRAAAIAIGLLTSVTILNLFDRFDSAGGFLFLALLVVGTGAVAVFYLRSRAVRLFALYLSPAPVIFAVLFLFASSAQPLLFGQSPEVLAAQQSNSSVVILVFDELPLGALLRENGEIDRDRYPGFADLAATSTWYPRATTVAPWTHLAIPAILTGRLPDPTVPPVAGQNPRSLFTLLGASHHLHVNEQVTSLCPRSLCRSAESSSESASLVRDTSIVALHQLLPAGLAERWLPSVSGSWTNFGQESDLSALPQDDIDLEFDEWRSELESEEVSAAGLPSFVASLSRDSVPGLWYQHEMLPHMPYQFLPDGRTYEGGIPGSLSADWVWWSDEPLSSVNAEQRMLLQLGYVDAYVRSVLDRLRQEGMLRDTLLVVVSDHGITFGGGAHRRGVFEDDGSSTPIPTDELASKNGNDVLPIPLFVKYPGQVTGTVDTRDAETIDVLPTIADALELTLPEEWIFDGRSLLADPPESDQPGHWIAGNGTEEDVLFTADPLHMTRDIARLFGPSGKPHDLYAVGPYRDLVGQEVDGVPIGPTVEDARVMTANAMAYDDVDLSRRSVPALYTASVTGVEPGSWLAVAIDGTIAGLGPVYGHRDGHPIVEVMIDPAIMVEGDNDVRVYLVSPAGPTLSPVPTV
jgi:hypothetical protein